MNISNNIRKLTQMFIILFLALSGGLVYWQVVVAQQITSNTHNIRHCLPDSAPFRGRILDRRGVVLAKSKLTNNGCGYQRFYYLNNYPSLAGLIGYYISPFFSSTGIEHEFNDTLNGGIGLTSLNNIVDHTLHRPPLGDDIYLTIDVRMQALLDKYFDQAPVPDNNLVFPTDRGSAIISDPHTGEILAMLSRPTFDPNCAVSCTLQRLKDLLGQRTNELRQLGYNLNGYDLNCQAPCSIDQFKVALQKQNYDPNCEVNGDCNLIYLDKLNKDPEQPLLERPIQDTYVPGSTYKTVTLLAGLDSGKVSLNDLFYNDKDPNHAQAIGPVTLGQGNETETFGPVGNNLQPYTTKFPVTLNYGYTHSDNVIYAQTGVKEGADTWLDYNNRFYVGKQIPFDLPVIPSSVLPKNGHLGVNLLGENAFGQGIDSVSPLQMTMFDNGIANNGNLMRPSLILKIVDPNGTVVQSLNPQSLGTQISSTTASQMRDAMDGVVQCGSGRFGFSSAPQYDPELYHSQYGIIAKTGTGQVGGNKGAESWLFTQAPYQNPVLTIVAMKENGGEGALAIGPMVRHVYDDIFTNIMKISTVQPAPLDYCQTHELLQ